MFCRFGKCKKPTEPVREVWINIKGQHMWWAGDDVSYSNVGASTSYMSKI